MAEFELSRAVLTTRALGPIVPDIVVRIKSNNTFSLLSGSPPSCPGLDPSSPTPLPRQPFLRLEPATSAPDPTNRKFQIARLVFDPTAISGWQEPFNLCLDLIQPMQITDVGPKDLTINLSSAVEPLIVTNGVARLLIGMGEKIVEVASAFVLLLRRAFGKPVALLEEQAGGEASTSAR